MFSMQMRLRHHKSIQILMLIQLMEDILVPPGYFETSQNSANILLGTNIFPPTATAHVSRTPLPVWCDNGLVSWRVFLDQPLTISITVVCFKKPPCRPLLVISATSKTLGNCKISFGWLVQLRIPRWWFQIFLECSPLFGEDEPILTIIFFKGVVQPPPTWRIIPVSKWLITMVSKSPKWGYSPYKWPKWLLVGPW